MKKALTSSKIAVGIWIGFMIITVICLPLLITFTTNDRGPSIAFFIEMVGEFLLLVPFFLVVLILLLAVRSLLRYKLGVISKRTLIIYSCIYSTSALASLVSIIAIFVSTFSSNSTVIN